MCSVLAWKPYNYGVVCFPKRKKLFFRGEILASLLSKHQGLNFRVILHAMFGVQGYLEGVPGLFHQPDRGVSVVQRYT